MLLTKRTRCSNILRMESDPKPRIDLIPYPKPYMSSIPKPHMNEFRIHEFKVGCFTLRMHVYKDCPVDSDPVAVDCQGKYVCPW